MSKSELSEKYGIGTFYCDIQEVYKVEVMYSGYKIISNVLSDYRRDRKSVIFPFMYKGEEVQVFRYRF